MNIVKGVADLIRRSSSGQGGDSVAAGSQFERVPSAVPKVRFRDTGDEAVLNALWGRYFTATDKVERKKLFHVFLKQFLIAFKNWNPNYSGELLEATSPTVSSLECALHFDDVVLGCSTGHPAEVVLALTEEVGQLITLVTDLNTTVTHTTAEVSAIPASLRISSEGFPALEALTIVSRSVYNCRVFGYYGGIQKLTALMKAGVVQLKTITSALSAEETISTSTVERTGILQKILIHVVSIFCNFVDINLNLNENVRVSSFMEIYDPSSGSSSMNTSRVGGSFSETRLHWQKKAIVTVMEAGGLNWLVELLRVIRRLSLKEKWTGVTLRYLTLRALHIALSENPRGQNHFRSIGGLEVLLDGLGLSSMSVLALKSSRVERKRDEISLARVLHLHVLSLEVLREAVYKNFNNLQFLCENGRVHKFANGFSSCAFMLQEYGQLNEHFVMEDESQMHISDSKQESYENIQHIEPFAPAPALATVSFSQCWNDYATKLSNILCAFLLDPEETNSAVINKPLAARRGKLLSSVYGELSVKWAMRILLIVFPCIKACSNQNELPNHIREFVCILQHNVLNAFRKILQSLPVLIEAFREEGIWDLLFSENFFYFGPPLEEFSGAFLQSEHSSGDQEEASNEEKSIESETIQMKVISFVEFVANSNGSTHNLPECSALLDALEQCACAPDIAAGLAKSLFCILQLSSEKTLASFKALGAIPRVLKVVCIQARESRRGIINPSVDDFSMDSLQHQHLQISDWSKMSEKFLRSMETCMEIFSGYLSMEDGAKSLVLHSSESIDCLFDLFWEEGLRSYVLRHIIDLMKVVPLSEEHQRKKLQLCSKYLETFTQLKERDRSFAELSVDLLVGMKDMLLTDLLYYQTLFREGECFLHVVSLLNGNLDVKDGEKLVLYVLQILTCLLASNDVSKVAFRALVGNGYQTLQSLLLDFCQSQPSEALLNSLLDMLVDGKFDIKANPVIKNEDVIILYLTILQKSSKSLQHCGLNVFQQLLKDSISNQASCVRAGMLNFLLDWFSKEGDESIILKITRLIQVIGGHSISGKDIRKIFALLRSEKVGARQRYSLLLLSTISSMLNEKGPTAFFDFNGNDSGIIIKTPMEWPLHKGFSFSCWLRVENLPRSGMMALFSFLTDNGKGCFAVLTRDKLVYESINVKRQCVALDVVLVRKRWHHLCITHSIGRAFSGGSLLRCYLDGHAVASEKCRYAKVNELLTDCSIGARINFPLYEDSDSQHCNKDASTFLGQIGPVYMFNDAIASEQIQGIHSLGASYMYTFDNENASSDSSLTSEIFYAKDGLASKIIFGLNAQASDGKILFNVSPLLDHSLEKGAFDAAVLLGTQLCSRRLLQEIIYCVGGVSVVFPLFTHLDGFDNDEVDQTGQVLLQPITRERLTAEVIEIIASVLDENIANQQQMHLLSGFSILGFLLQSVPPIQLNLETLSALKHLFSVVTNCGLSELLVTEAISSIFLNPLVWVYTAYKVQRELYMFLVQQFDNDPRLLKSLCRLPRVIDIIRQFYWDCPKSRFAFGNKPLLHPVTKKVIGERPKKEEIHKIRLLLLSLGEMSLRQNIIGSDIRALVAFFETSQDMACIEDVLHMVIRAVSQKPLLASFLEQVDSIGGCLIFVNLLRRNCEPIRMLSLQFLGRLLVGLPSEKKGSKFFSIAVGRSRSLSESQKKATLRVQTMLQAISDRLFKFPQTEYLCATLFDVLLGGASPKQVLQKHNLSDKQRSKGHNSHFFLPQILLLIFRFISGCVDASARMKIIRDLLDLLDSNPSNIEALMENGWSAWLMASLKLDVLKNYKLESQARPDIEINEQHHVRTLYSVVLCHYMLCVKGGWQQLEETVNFILMNHEQGGLASQFLLLDLFKDLIQKLVEFSSEENIFTTQPCRDNTLYLLRLVDEILVLDIDHKLPYPASSSDFCSDSLELNNHKDLTTALFEALQRDSHSICRNSQVGRFPSTDKDDLIKDEFWNLYDCLWIIISEMNGKGPSKMTLKSPSAVGPSFGQRARGLVESLNIPAAEMAAVVVAGGIGNAFGGKPHKNADKAMLLRGEKCPRIVFRLVILYLCRSPLERTSRCVQQFVALLPCLLSADDEQSKSRLQLFIWAVLAVRSQYGMLDDGARFHVISHLLREAVSCGKLMLAMGIASRDDSPDSGSNRRETGTIYNLIQKDRVLAAVSEEVNYIKASKADRAKQLHELYIRLGEKNSTELNQKKAFEDDVHSSLSIILTSDDSRRAVFQLAYDEEQQTVAEKWIHMFRTLIDERGPWSATPFPNSALRHWKLDKTEDTWRRRPKMRQNYHFDEKLCQAPSMPNNEPLLPNDSTSDFRRHIPEQMKRFLLKGIHRITDEEISDTSESDVGTSGPGSTSEDISERQYSELEKDVNNPKGIVQDRKDYASTSSESETSEALLSVPCVLVTPKRKLAGHLAVMKNVLHFFGEFLVEGTGGSSAFNNFSTTVSSESTKSDQLAVLREKVLKSPESFVVDSDKRAAINNVDSVHVDASKGIKRHRRWVICKIKAVHWTRYLLRFTAVEIFFDDSAAPIFLNFSSQKIAKDVGTLIVATRNESLLMKVGSKEKNAAISFVDRRVAVELAEIARERWRRREITNFEYLMILNTLGGRSYNDLTQYPVFPWILADYTSNFLDFNKSSTFRDLSKPVGALDSRRFEAFEDRYRNFSDPDIPSFYYGSHYSSMGIVLFYLLRLEPFTALHRNLQGGKFDHADRLFQSIDGTYQNCLSNTSDVKELIPEFFYMPEFLTNSNSYHLGVKQDGDPIGDVCLPAWAKGSPEEFISRNREALESEYVSSNLHHWIDLVFGYKQRGKPAVEAANIFYYLTYEGAVDLDSVDDELQRSALEDQIANFGQTPIQIFRKKHPRRGPPIPIAHPLHFAPGSINLTSIISSTSSSTSAVLYVGVVDSTIIIVNQGLTMSVKMWLTTQLQSGGNFTFSSSQDPFFGIGSDILSTRKIGSPLAEKIELGSPCFAAMQTASDTFLITCGNWENSFQIISVTDGRTVQSIRQHKDIVSCVAVTSDGSILATGSYDTTVMVWEVSRFRIPEKKVRGIQSEVPRKGCVIVETPFHILCGHDDIITCLYVSKELDIVISGSKDGTCVFHTLRQGRYVRSLQHPSGSPLSKLVASQHGRVVFYADDDLSLHLYSINGKHIATSESNGRLNSIELSSCGEFLVCAGDQGQIVVWSMNSLEIVRRYDGVGKIITSLTVTPEECFLAGTKDGSLLVYSIENLQLRRGSLPRNVKYKAPATV